MPFDLSHHSYFHLGARGVLFVLLGWQQDVLWLTTVFRLGLVFKAGSHIALADLRLAMLPRLTLNFWDGRCVLPRPALIHCFTDSVFQLTFTVLPKSNCFPPSLSLLSSLTPVFLVLLVLL